jgi:hypothetical protein
VHTLGIMSRREPWSIALAVSVVAGVAALGGLPARMELGSLLATAALALLLQGFVRDLHTLARLRREGAAPGSEQEMACICLESTIGLSAILVGVGLTASGLALPVSTPAGLWPLVAGAVWSFGYMTRDVVLQWSPWALRRVRDHGSLVVRWRAARSERRG